MWSMGLTEALLGLGILFLIPAALQLHPDFDKSWSWAVTGTALLAGFSLQDVALPNRVAVATPWVVVALVLAAVAGWRWVRHDRSLEAIVWPASLAYLLVGAVWLLLHALRVEPVGVKPPFVLLTALHFHYAGFTATLLAALVRRHAANASPGLSAAMIAAVVTAPPIVALGFTFVGVLQVIGAAVLTAGLFALSWLTLRHVVPDVTDRLARVLLVVSALAVLVPMLLALQWAVGWNYGTPALSIPAMARTHGVVNAVGFALCGVLGWRRLDGRSGVVGAALADGDVAGHQ